MTATSNLLLNKKAKARRATKPSTDEMLKAATSIAIDALDHLHEMLEAKIEEVGPASAAQYSLVLCKVRMEASALRLGIIHPDKNVEERVEIMQRETDEDKEAIKKMATLTGLLAEVARDVKLRAVVSDVKSDNDE